MFGCKDKKNDDKLFFGIKKGKEIDKEWYSVGWKKDFSYICKLKNMRCRGPVVSVSWKSKVEKIK